MYKMLYFRFLFSVIHFMVIEASVLFFCYQLCSAFTLNKNGFFMRSRFFREFCYELIWTVTLIKSIFFASMT